MPFHYVRSQDDPLLTDAAFKEICGFLRVEEKACRHLDPFLAADKAYVWLSGVEAPDYAKKIAGQALDANHMQINVPVPFAETTSFCHATSPKAILAHETHHVARLRAVGHDGAFGTAGRFIVSEGLAVLFETEATGNNPYDAFDVTDGALRFHENDLRDAARLKINNYLQNVLFLSRPLVRYPRFIGYALGARLVGGWLMETGRTAAQSYNMNADEILEPWLRGKPFAPAPVP